MALFTGLVRNELRKTWRSRWIVFAVLGGIFVLIAGGLYIYYVASQNRWSPPPPVAWQDTLRMDIASNQQQLKDMQQFQQGCSPNDPKCPPAGAQPDLSQPIAQLKQQIADDQYLLDNNIAPVQSFSITIAAVFGLGGIVMFLLLRIFGWLASEQIAGERSDRTIAILLSRPMSRNQLLLAKAVASFLISLGVVVVSFLVIYAITSFIEGSLGPVTGQVGIAVDGSKPMRGSNQIVMPIYLFVLMCFGGAMLGVLCVQGMSLLISAVFGRWAAIGITLAVLFGAPLVSTVVTVVIYAISQDITKAHFLNYLFFNVLAPVSALTPVFGSGPGGPSGATGTGIGEFGFQVSVLTAWTLAFFVAAWALFRRKQESS
jgi:ABC-2 type transport system permease protein